MANITDFSDALTKEGELAKKYVVLRDEASNDDYKTKLDELVRLSEEKMKIVHGLIKDIPWFKD